MPPLALASPIRGVIAGFDPSIVVGRVETMEVLVDEASAREGFLAALLSLATLGTLFLAGVGIYGVVACTVRRRTGEIGIRLALGADAGEIRRLVVGKSFGIVVAGVAFGVAGTVVLTGALGSLLFEISPTDPWTIGAAVAVILVTAVVAGFLPARRATRLDPLVAIRMP